MSIQIQLTLYPPLMGSTLKTFDYPTMVRLKSFENNDHGYERDVAFLINFHRHPLERRLHPCLEVVRRRIDKFRIMKPSFMKNTREITPIVRLERDRFDFCK